MKKQNEEFCGCGGATVRDGWVQSVEKRITMLRYGMEEIYLLGV